MNVSEINSDEVIDDANAFCDSILSNRDVIESKANKVNSEKKETMMQAPPDVQSIELLHAENEKLKHHLSMPVREYPDVKAAMEKLKDLNYN